MTVNEKKAELLREYKKASAEYLKVFHLWKEKTPEYIEKAVALNKAKEACNRFGVRF